MTPDDLTGLTAYERAKVQIASQVASAVVRLLEKLTALIGSQVK